MFENNIFTDTDQTDTDFDNTHQHLDPSISFKEHDYCKYVFNLNEISEQNSTLTIMTFNIRSIRNKFKKFVSHLSTIKMLPDIIAINESWLSNSDNLLDYQANK